MNSCPTCGAPQPNEDWDWNKIAALHKDGCTNPDFFGKTTVEEQYRLFVAAPELLAALRLARDDLSDLLEVADLTDEGVADTTEVLNKVIAAIAKAEGLSTSGESS